MLSLVRFLLFASCISNTALGCNEESGHGYDGINTSPRGAPLSEISNFRNSDRTLYKATCVPPSKYSGWCYFFSWMSSCKGKETASWKVYNDIATMDPTNENLRFYVNTLFAPFEDLKGASYDSSLVLEQVGKSSRANECIREVILNAYCNMALLKSFEGWLDDILAIKSADGDLYDTIASLSDLDLDILEDILPEDIYMVVFKAAAAMIALPTIAKGLMGALIC